MGMEESFEILAEFTIVNPKNLENKLKSAQIDWHPSKLGFYGLSNCKICSYRFILEINSRKYAWIFMDRVNSMEKLYTCDAFLDSP